MTAMARNLELSRRRLLAGGLAALAAPALPAWAQLPPLPRARRSGGAAHHLCEPCRRDPARDRARAQCRRAADLGPQPGRRPLGARRRDEARPPHLAHLPDVPREGLVVNKADLGSTTSPRSGRCSTTRSASARKASTPRSGPPGSSASGTSRPGSRPAASINEKPWLPRVVLPGPDNPAGRLRHGFRLSGSYLVHSTNKPYGVGRRVSHGCIRMYPEGMERLFPQVALGSRAMVIDQAVKVGWHQGELYLQVMPSMTQIDELEATAKMSPEPPPPASSRWSSPRPDRSRAHRLGPVAETGAPGGHPGPGHPRRRGRRQCAVARGAGG